MTPRATQCARCSRSSASCVSGPTLVGSPPQPAARARAAPRAAWRKQRRRGSICISSRRVMITARTRLTARQGLQSPGDRSPAALPGRHLARVALRLDDLLAPVLVLERQRAGGALRLEYHVRLLRAGGAGE